MVGRSFLAEKGLKCSCEAELELHEWRHRREVMLNRVIREVTKVRGHWHISGKVSDMPYVTVGDKGGR